MLEKREVDTLVLSANIFTGNQESPNVKDGAIAVKGGRIVAVGPQSTIVQEYSAQEVIDAGGGIVHPGYIEPHLHLMSVPFHSLSIDPDGTSAARISYSSVKTETDDASVRAFAASTAMSCLKKGFTLFVEPGTLFETGAFAEAVSAVGSRAMISAPYGWDDVKIFYELMPGTMSDKLMQRAPASAKRVVDQLRHELRRNQDADALVKAFVCLYGVGSSSSELMQECVALARAHKVVYCQHSGYLPEYLDAEERYFGVSDIQRLAQLNGLGHDISLTHMNVVRPADAEVVEATGTNVLWSPLNALHRGIHLKHRCYHPQWHKAGHTVAIASDSALEYPIGSAGLAALFLSGAVGDRLESSAPFYMQTIQAAKSLGIDHELGSIEAGKRADIVIRKAKDLSEIPLSGSGNLLAVSSAMMEVDTVLVNGRTILKEGQLQLVDEEKVVAEGIFQRDELVKRVSF